MLGDIKTSQFESHSLSYAYGSHQAYEDKFLSKINDVKYIEINALQHILKKHCFIIGHKTLANR